jgi:hypothetical protein
MGRCGSGSSNELFGVSCKGIDLMEDRLEFGAFNLVTLADRVDRWPR